MPKTARSPEDIAEWGFSPNKAKMATGSNGGGVFDILGGAAGAMPGFTGGGASSASDALSGSIYSGPIDNSISMPFTFGGSGAGVNTGLASMLPLVLAGGLVLLGVKWLAK